ncbi:MAG: CcdB family protein [Pseudomonadota bacterium]
MAQFDVYKNPVRPGYLIDCQSELLDVTDTRVTIPLLAIDEAPRRMAYLNPIFEIVGEPHVLVTQFATAVRLKSLGSPVSSLADRHDDILRAIDVLLGGV